MNFVHLFQRLMHQASATPEQDGGGCMDTDWAFSSREAVGAFLTELTDSRQDLIAHGLDGRFIGHALLTAMNGSEVQFQMRCESGQARSMDAIRINVWSVLKHGATMFTLHARRLGLADLWSAPFPREVIRMQSRRHRRLRCIHGPIYSARLSLGEPFQDVNLIDLSEEGAGLTCSTKGDVPLPDRISGTLWLQGTPMSLPNVQVMHSTRVKETQWRIGVRLLGLSEADSRALRCWLNTVEACQGRVPERAQAVAVAPASAVALSSR